MKRPFVILWVVVVTLLLPASALAQGNPAVQELDGSIAPGQQDVFRLASLEQGQTLYAFMENTSGNLDPLLFILPGNQDPSATLDSYNKAAANLLNSSATPLLDLPALRDKYFLAWDDDSGPGYTAALKFVIPTSGDYYLVAGSSLSAIGRQTAGSFRLLIGLDEPQVLSGSVAPTGAVIAVQDRAVLESQLVQEYTATLDQNKPTDAINLSDLNPGDTLYVSVQAASGDLKPILYLRDFGQKPVRVINLNGQSSSAELQQPFPKGGTGYVLDIQAASSNGQLTTGSFKLLAGVNAPEVLQGQAQANTQSLLKLAIPVQIGFKLQQIVSIDQPNEIMNTVGTLKLDWSDPALAFDPGKCNCSSRVYTDNDYNKFLSDVQGKWPAFTFFNQQGNRWTQNRLIQVDSDGHVVYLERFTTNFQLDFNWVAFPFDRQDFYVRVDMLYPEDEYVFVPMENFNEIDPHNGEDEFILSGYDTAITSETSSRLVPTSRFTFHFSAPRHTSYYLFRIFIPVLLIITVSYITFFLKDFTRRIEIATGNLLLFIAFSFSLGDNYPRLGYLTFLDAIMAITFIINAAVVVLNVYYKRLETEGQRERADRLEAPMNYLYPLAYVILFGAAALIFLR